MVLDNLYIISHIIYKKSCVLGYVLPSVAKIH